MLLAATPPGNVAKPAVPDRGEIPEQGVLRALLRQVKPCAFRWSRATNLPWCEGRLCRWTGDFSGEAVMARVLNDILLFSCIAAFVTGIVLAAASLLT